MRTLLLNLLLLAPAMGQTITDCRTIFIRPMPEGLDRFVSAELVRWGEVKVLTDEDRADCVLAFSAPEARVSVRSSGSAIVPRDTEAEGSSRLPRSYLGHSQAALDLVHVASSTVVWAASKGNMWITESQRDLGRKLAKQLRKDYQKAQKVRAGKEKPKG